MQPIKPDNIITLRWLRCFNRTLATGAENKRMVDDSGRRRVILKGGVVDNTVFEQNSILWGLTGKILPDGITNKDANSQNEYRRTFFASQNFGTTRSLRVENPAR